MANWYVSPTGDDTTGDGSQSLPYKHIYKAWQELADGDTIYCEDGTYDEEDTPLVDVNKGFTLRSVSADYEKVIIIPTELGSPGVSQRLTWLGDAGTYPVYLFDLTLVFDDAVITTAYTVGYNSLVYHQGAATSPTVTRCFFRADSVPNDYYIFGVMRDYATSAYEADIYKCTFRGWTNNAKSAGVYSWKLTTSYPGLKVIDSIFEGCYYGIWTNSTVNAITENNNCFYNNTYNIRKDTTNITPDSTDVLTDPDFTSASSAETASGSPCKDAGVTVSGYVETYSGNAPDVGCYELEPQILLYTGEYNDGSSSGTVNLSERVLTIGQISEVLMGGVNRPWVQQTSVTIDDSDGYFLGTLSKGTEWYDGTFDIYGEHGTAWEKLLTGFVPTAAWSYNYGEQTATINVTSMLLRASTVSMGYGGSVYTPLGYSSQFRSPVFFHNGTITDIDTDGTVTVEYYDETSVPWPWQLGALCWTEADTVGTINQEAFAPAPINSVGSWEGTAVSGSTTKHLSKITFLGGTKDWMSIGRSIVPTVPWPASVGFPTQTTSIIDMLDVAVGSMGLTWDSASKTKFESDLLIVPATLSFYNGTEILTGAPISNGAVPRYFGGQPWVDTVNDIMESVGANWTVSGIGEVHARIKRASALESVTGTVDFNDARRYINEQWMFSESEGLSAARVYHEWNDIEQKFEGTAVTDGSFDSGAMMKMSAKWQRDLGGKLLANRSMTWEKAISRLFPLPFPKEDWGSLVPGSPMSLINIPTTIQPNYGSGAAPLIAEGKYMITARHYDYMNESITVDLRQSPPLTGVFILDHSHLDGTDKLY